MPTDTKTRILDAAEALFAEHGFQATSMRSLTSAAGVNLAAVHYHFGSKEGLFRAAAERLVGPVNRERLRLFEELEAQGEHGLEPLLRAFLGPALRVGTRGDDTKIRLRRFMGRVNFSEGGLEEPLREVFSVVEQRFMPAFRRALPHLDDASFFWRLHFMFGTMCMALFDPGRLSMISRGLCDPDDADQTLEQMIAFVVAGLTAPQGSPAAASVDSSPIESTR